MLAVTKELQEQAIGEINRAVEDTGMTQVEIAKRMGTTRSYVNQLLVGNKLLTIKGLTRLGRILNGRFELTFHKD